VPDAGARPTALGTIVLPGQQAPGTPTPTPTTSTSSSPVVQKADKGQAEIDTLGDQLIRLGQERDLAKTQSEAAATRYARTQETLRQAQSDAGDAAADTMREMAAMPPGAFDPSLMGLDDLARIQRGENSGQGAAAQQLENAQLDDQLALDEMTLAEKKYNDLVAQWNKQNAALKKKEAAQQAYEAAHAPELNAADVAQTARDSSLAQKYLSGTEAGRSADPRAAQALQFALRQIGKPYEWSEEGPGTFDCSGLMWAAYRSVGVSLDRVSRDQYLQTRDKVVDRYSLLPGDLIFFSYSNSWQGIHHVAMYAGNGMMVEAPRTGLDVRLTKVRWSQMFQATRVLGSVEGVTQGPDLSHITPDDSNNAGGGTPATKPPTKPSTPVGSKPPTKPSDPPTKPSDPPTKPSDPPSQPSDPPTKPSDPPSQPSDPPTKPSDPPSQPSDPPTKPSDPPTTPAPSTDPSDPGSSGGGSSSPEGSGDSSSSGGSPSSSSAQASEHATKSASATESKSEAATETKSSSATPSGSK
jgi:cell wall-associated NlpC family hydrolase